MNPELTKEIFRRADTPEQRDRLSALYMKEVQHGERMASAAIKWRHRATICLFAFLAESVLVLAVVFLA